MDNNGIVEARDLRRRFSGRGTRGFEAVRGSEFSRSAEASCTRCWERTAGVYFAVVAAFYVITYRMSVWMLSLVWEIDDARAAQAKLAVAEERLRFARDFHDVLGRNLTLIAVTSELAARLAGNGDPHAVDHMLEVHRVAHESAREVREVVAGYRTTDLDAELAGASAVEGPPRRIRQGGDEALVTLLWVPDQRV